MASLRVDLLGGLLERLPYSLAALSSEKRCGLRSLCVGNGRVRVMTRVKQTDIFLDRYRVTLVVCDLVGST